MYLWAPILVNFWLASHFLNCRRTWSNCFDFQFAPCTKQFKATTSHQTLFATSVLTHPRLLLVYAITALGYGGTFTAFTFLAPILEQVSGFSSSAIGLIMLVYGVSVAVGNIWGGKMVGKMGPIKALTIIFSGLATILVVFNFTAVNPIAATATILIWGAFAFGNVPGCKSMWSTWQKSTHPTRSMSHLA